jgi:hypothetical protein
MPGSHLFPSCLPDWSKMMLLFDVAFVAGEDFWAFTDL